MNTINKSLFYSVEFDENLKMTKAENHYISFIKSIEQLESLNNGNLSHDYNDLAESALKHVVNASEMIEPSMHLEPTRTLLHLNAAILAGVLNKNELHEKMASNAMYGNPPKEFIQPLRDIIKSSNEQENAGNAQLQFNEGEESYKPKKKNRLITNLPRKQKFLAQLLDDFPDAAHIDIIVSDFEIASFLMFAGKWQFADKIRILVNRKLSQTFNVNDNAFIQHKQNLSIEREKESNDDLAGLHSLKQALIKRQVEVGLYQKDDIFGSAYIIKKIDGDVNCYLGSANFVESSFINPLQIITNLTNDNCKEIQIIFDAAFKASKNLNEALISIIDHHIRELSPYQIYLKSLYEFFKGREIATGVWESEESKVYPVLSNYQRDGYKQLLHIASKYNGALLCDGVGLGKTFIALMIIERLVYERKRVVVIVPKSTRDSIWEYLVREYIPNSRSLFGSQVVIYNHTDLLRKTTNDRDFPAEMEEITSQCDAIIVDEAHHFRNLTSKRNQKLFEMTANKMVFLLTATPINNTLFDLQHLIEFFTRRDDSRFATLGINSIRGHLIQKERAIEAMMNIDNNEDQLLADFDTIKADRVLRDDTLFREVVVQRSRTYVRSLEQDTTKEPVFPERQAPNVAAYSLKKTYGILLDELRKVFDRDDPLLKLPIYYPMAYARKPSESVEDKKEENRQKQIVGLVRTTLLKRFESSWSSFRYTCEDLLLKLIAVLRAVDEKSYNEWLQKNTIIIKEIEKHLAQRFDIDMESEEIEEEDLLTDLTVTEFSIDNRIYRVKDFLADVIQDMDVLINFLSHLRGLSSEQDEKVQTLIKYLQSDELLSKHKVIIFTEFRDTARYLYETLYKVGIKNLFEIDSGTNVNRLEVIRRFAPYYNYSNEEILKKALAKPIRVLISTDILAEGLNLQDSFLMINYDLHWNPVRLMQRIGRVDRRMDLETERRILIERPDEKDFRGKMWYWNFLPPDELSDLLSLYKRVSHKVLRISETTGLEGEKLLTPEDHFKTLRDFNAAYEGKATTEEHLRLLLNKALKDNPGLESFLESLPWRVFSAKNDECSTPGVFTCYRFPMDAKHKQDHELGEMKWYFLPDNSDEVLINIDEINNYIASSPYTVAAKARPLSERRARLSIIENYIRKNDFKTRKAVTMSQVAGPQGDAAKMHLIAWLEVVPKSNIT